MPAWKQRSEGAESPFIPVGPFKLRLPFPRPAEDREDVKTLIVEMTQTSLGNPDVQAAMQEMMAAEKAEAA